MLQPDVFVAEKVHISRTLTGHWRSFVLLFPGNLVMNFWIHYWYSSIIFQQKLGYHYCSLCRFTFVIAFLLLLTGAALNEQHGEENMYFGNYYCYVVKPGVFAGAAVLSLASVSLGIVYYLTLISAKNTNDPWCPPAPSSQGGIAMGQPQFPPQTTQDPVFVHEDTYMRRQLA